MSVHKYKSRNKDKWYVKYQNRTKRGFSTKREAEIYEAQQKLLNQNNYKATTAYYSDVALDYLQSVETSVSEATNRKNKRIFEEFIIPNIENKKISEIKSIDCRKFREYVEKLPYDSGYKNAILRKYKIIFLHGKRYYNLQSNPSEFLAMYKKTFEEKLKKNKRELDIWSTDDFNKFIDCVHREKYKQLFTILYYTGMRLGEALALKWSDYNGISLNITKSASRDTKDGPYKIKDTKTPSSIRKVDIGKNLADYLNCFKESESGIPGFNEDWFIFGRISPLPHSTIDRIKEGAIKNSGVRRIRIHDFRHSHASNLIANGMSIVAVSKRLGHSNINTTLGTYAHLAKKSEDELLEFLDKSSQNLLK